MSSPAGIAMLAGLSGVVLGLSTGCAPANPGTASESLLVTQAPVNAPRADSATSWLDARYPAGSRIVLVTAGSPPGSAWEISRGLVAAGEPALGPDGRQVLFSGKATADSAWQIYRAMMDGGAPEPLTGEAAGAMNPAWLPGGRFVFSAPVPSTRAPSIPALYSASITGGPPVRLTFGLVGATDPTVLADGRILFVSGVPEVPGTSLFTINNDGTEPTPFAAQHGEPVHVRRPRETTDGRVVLVAEPVGSSGSGARVEQVRMARPYRSREVVWPAESGKWLAVEPLADGALLGALKGAPASGSSLRGGLYRLPVASGASPAEPRVLVEATGWQNLEALSATARFRPRGRISSVDPHRPDAMLLCLDARVTDRGPVQRTPTRVRIYEGSTRDEVARPPSAPLAADGSFLVKVTPDVALGVELLDDAGVVVRRCPPSFWLRPGENRTCVGCHEPHNRAPENARPLAVLQPPVSMVLRETAAAAGGRP